MRHLVTLAILLTALTARATPDAGHFELHESGTAAKSAHGAHESKLEPTKTDAVLKFFVIDKDKGPVKGIVIELVSPAGAKFFTEETDAEGYAEALVPVGQRYELTYLSLGRKDIAANVDVKNEPKQTVKLTLRYKPRPPAPPFVLKGVTFDTARATIRPESYPMLDVVAEFMAHKKSARLEISGHTDNVGNAKANKKLSEDRAKACRNYIVGKGIDVGRMTAIGYGDTRPMVPNDSDENRQKNRRIEAVEIVAN
jgi:outer membrane protein OmpA-like peptidoglycan-associated protein